VDNTRYITLVHPTVDSGLTITYTPISVLYWHWILSLNCSCSPPAFPVHPLKRQGARMTTTVKCEPWSTSPVPVHHTML